MIDTREITDDYGPGDSFPYNGTYLFYEQYAVFARETALSVGLACMMVYIVTVIMFADFITSGIVLLMVGMIDINILGMLYFWGLTLNAVTIAMIVISVGIAVDYNAHIAHAFKNVAGSREDRVIKSLETLGVSVLHGAISTLLAVLVLSGS
jgi:Niemann-Pick C1 protein